MPQVRISDEARQDLGRFSDFLMENGATDQAKAVIGVILQGLRLLESHPIAGRAYPIEGKEFREVLIKYGASGYACLYSFDQEADLVIVHAIRHQRELGYSI
jgi:plasmid stabilization system protein ParE